MKKGLLSISLMLLSVASMYSQTSPTEPPRMRWVKTFGGTKEDYPTQLVKVNNDYYVAGTTGSDDFGFQDSISYTDGFIAKLNSSGNLQFIKTHNKYTNANIITSSMVFMSDSSLITGGVTDELGGSAIIFDKFDLNGNPIVNSQGKNIHYGGEVEGLNNELDNISNMYSNGNYLGVAFSAAYDIPDSAEFGYIELSDTFNTRKFEAWGNGFTPTNVVPTPNKGELIIGEKNGVDTCLLFNIDSSGLVTYDIFNHVSEDLYASAVTKDSNYIATGAIINVPNKESDIVVNKYDKNLNIIWSRSSPQFSGNNLSTGCNVIMMKNGHYLISGTTNSTEGVIYSKNGGNDLFLMEIDTSGSPIWWNSYGSPQDDEFIKTGTFILNDDGTIVFAFETYSTDKNFGVSNGVGDIGVMKLQYTPEIISKLADSLNVCQGTDTLFALKETFWADSIQWYKNHIAIVGANNDTLKLTNIQPNDANNIYTCYIFNKYGKDSTQFNIKTVYPTPQVSINAPSNACLHSQVSLSSSISSGTQPFLYSWNDNSTTTSVTKTISNDISVAITVTDAHNCTATSNTIVDVLKPYTDSLAVVTYDPTSQSIEIAWNRTQGKRTAYYLIKVEANIVDSFITIKDTLLFSHIGYLPINNDPSTNGSIEQKQYSFQLITVDSVCNNQAISPVHSSIFLQQGTSSQDTTAVNLIWTPYVGLSPKTYEIWKNGDSVASVNGSQTAFTYSASSNKIDDVYQIKFKLDESFDYSKLKSTTIDYATSNSFKTVGATGIKTVTDSEIPFTVYPNPNTGSFDVSISKNAPVDNSTAELYDLIGTKITEKKFESSIVHFMGISEGVYICKVQIGDKTSSAKIIVK